MKETDVRARITKELKDKFLEKLEQDGISQSDFILTCIMNYIGIKTLPDEWKSSNMNKSSIFEKRNDNKGE